MQDSIFTKIIRGEIPCHKIYEDEHTFAFLDIHPVCEGHTLVVHKRPAQFVWDLNDVEYAQLMATAKKIANHYRAVSGKPYVKLSIVGTDVPHNHLHLMPFTTTDETHTSGRGDVEPDHDALALVAEKLRLL
jgi:histidine triad (HIT) family protein